MSETTFELNVSLPHDRRFAPAARDLAVQAAARAGCGRREAEAFGRAVEGVLAGCLGGHGGSQVDLVFRSAAGGVEVLVSCDQVFDPAPSDDRDIFIGWTRDGSRPRCRIARPAPLH
jgi:hypothetical protein